MGYSVAMNNLGAVIAINLSSILSTISWKYSFLVYLQGIISIILVLIFLPKDKIVSTKSKISKSIAKKESIYLISMFLYMLSFYAFVINFAVQSVQDNILNYNNVGIIMSLHSVAGVFLALAFGKIAKVLNKSIKYLGPFLTMLAFIILATANTAVFYSIATLTLGAGIGLTVATLNNSAMSRVDKSLDSSVMALMSIALYLGQFLSPIVIGILQKTLNITNNRFPYMVAIITLAIILVLTLFSKSHRKE